MIGFWLRMECISLGKNVVAWRLADLIKMTVTGGRGDMPISHCKARYYRQHQACQWQKSNSKRDTQWFFRRKWLRRKLGTALSASIVNMPVWRARAENKANWRCFLTQSQRSKKKKKTHKTKVSPRLRSNRSITEMYSPSDRVSHLTVPPIGWSPLCPVAPTLWHPEGQIRNTESGEEVLRTWTWSSIVVENLPWVVHLFGGAPHSGHERKSDKASALKQLLLRAER